MTNLWSTHGELVMLEHTGYGLPYNIPSRAVEMILASVRESMAQTGLRKREQADGNPANDALAT